MYCILYADVNNVKNLNSLTYGVPSPGEEAPDETLPDLVEEIELVDYVVGNPPFVRNERVPAEDRPTLEKLYSRLQAGNTDLAAYFLYAALEYWLKPEGVLGMVAPLSIANAGMAHELRRYLNGYQITSVVSLEWLRLRKEIFQGIDVAPHAGIREQSKTCFFAHHPSDPRPRVLRRPGTIHYRRLLRSGTFLRN